MFNFIEIKMVRAKLLLDEFQYKLKKIGTKHNKN